MANRKSLEATTQFDDPIRDRVANIRQTDCCLWCKDPRYAIHNKSTRLCASCYRWYKMQQKLEIEVGQLPPEQTRDPYFQLRMELDIANQAITDCKRDGNVREDRLNRVEPIDLERMFDCLSSRVLGKKRGANLFHGKSKDFSLFSPTQRIWIWHLLFNILSEEHKKNRGRQAFSGDLQRKNREADVRYV